jgi:hypothetical protein
MPRPSHSRVKLAAKTNGRAAAEAAAAERYNLTGDQRRRLVLQEVPAD